MQDDDLLVNVTEVDGAKVLPPCVILGRLGVGGMGAVYKAFHLNLKCDVAVKVLKPQLVADDPSLVERFEREGRAAARINNPYVIGVRDICEHSGLHYIIMEFVDGENGRARVKRKGALPVGEALQIVYEAAQGLDAAHRIGIIHRDIKPDNLMIGKEGVKVADLGLAKATLGGGGNSMLSQPNTVMGTAAYMPPEQWESAATTATDVWALGATLWYFLAGRDAFTDPEANYLRIMKKIVMQPFPDIKAVCPDLPDDVVALLAKMTAKELPDRFQDAEQVVDAIAQMATKRTSLRVRTKIAPAPEAPTIVTPGPAFNIEKIKDWMREDANTRVERAPTPPRGNRTQARKPPVPAPEPEPAPPTDTVPQPRPITDKQQAPPKPTPPPRSKPPKPEPVPEPVAPGDVDKRGGTEFQPQPKQVRWGLVAAVVVVLCGSIGFGVKSIWFSDQVTPIPPNPTPEDRYAKLSGYEAQEDWAAAIIEMNELKTADARLEKDQQFIGRLAGNYGKRAASHEKKEEFASALVQLQAALSVKENDPDLMAQREKLYENVKGKANARLKALEPEGPVKKNAKVRCRATCDVDAVKALELEDATADKQPTGEFAAEINTGEAAQIKVGVILVDGKKLLLDPWKLTYVPEDPKALLFSAKPKATRYTDTTEQLALTEQDKIEVSGKLSQGEAELFQDETRVGSTEKDGSFTVRLKVAEEAKKLPLTLTAKKKGFTDEAATFDVVRLSKAPAPKVEPKLPDTTKDAQVTLTVVADEWTKAVSFQVGAAKAIDLPKPANGTTWTGTVLLNAGKNDITVRATNVADKTGPAGPFTVTRVVEEVKPVVVPAAITTLSLTVGSGKPGVLGDEVQYLATPEATLEIECSGTDPKVTVNGEEVTMAAGKGTARLRKDLTKDGEFSFEIAATNSATKPARTRTIKLVLDTTKPAVVATRPAPVAKDAVLMLSGTCTDQGGIDKVQVTDGKVTKDAQVKDGKWVVTLDGPQTARTLSIVAFDRAQNQSPSVPVQIEIAAAAVVDNSGNPNPKPPAINKQLTDNGFASGESAVTNAAGWPDRIVHTPTGIALVAVGAVPNGKPAFYGAIRMVTEAQYSGSGSDTAVSGVSGNDATRFVAERGAVFDLPRPDEWDALAKVPGVRETEVGGIVEWLVGDPSTNTHPLRKDPRKQSAPQNKGAGYGFRVVYRP